MNTITHCRFRHAVLRFALAAGMAVVFRSSAASLQISRVPTNVVVSWPTSAGSATLQFADELPPASGWIAFPRARSTNGASLRVNDASQVPSRFFRLFDGGPPRPPQLTVSGPASIRIGEAGAVTLNYADPNGDLALLTVTRTNSYGGQSSPIPAAWLGLGGTNGQITIPLDANQLPFGTTQLGFRLTDLTGLSSDFQALTLQVNGVAAGGTAPSIVFDTSTNVPTSFDPPGGIFDRFRPRIPISYSDPEGDIYRVDVRVIAPGRTNLINETAAALSMTGTSGVVSIPFLTFSNTSPLGAYTIEITARDRNGNVGATASGTFQLVFPGSGQAAAPRFSFFSGFTPTNGGVNTEVTISGIGFDPVPANNRVFLNDVPLAVLDSSVSMLRVRVTEAAESGPFIIHTANGGAVVTPRSFYVPPSVKVLPENEPTDETGAAALQIQVAVGSPLQLRARVVPTTPGGDRAVNWSVNGLAGGHATVGTITSNGLFTAPGRVPTGQVVRILSRLRSAPAVTGALDLVITPMSPLPGAPTLVRATEGGTVFARDLRASIQIPPAALSADTSITAREPEAVPVAQPGRRVLGYAEFLPSGTVFHQPAEVTLPLKRVLSPGSVLPLRFYQPATGAYTDEGITAVVTEAGDRATASLTHFTIVVVDEPETAASAPPPTIASIDPVLVLEGERVPLRLLGTGLDADATIEIRNANGTPASTMVAETYLGRGLSAGVLLKVGSIGNFDAGTREYRLRVIRPGGGAAEMSFQVQGLPELAVGAGQTLNVDGAPTWTVSGVHVAAGGRLVVQGGKLEVESTGDVLIEGVIDASGGRGGDGYDREPGRPGPRGHGGEGGWGRVDSDGFFGLDGAEPENYGKNANDALGYSEPEQGFSRPFGQGEREPQGIGGPPGGNLNVNPSQIAAKIVECVGTFGVACLHSADELARLGRQIVNVIDGNAPGKRGYGAVKNSALDETGGGGGGGAGMISVSVSLDIVELLFGFDLPTFLDGVAISIAVPGGGGGGGGDGGRDVSIRTPGTIQLGDTAQITTAGGDGGNGSSSSTWDVSVTPLYIPPIPGLPALSGGAGGGGRAGHVNLVSGLGLQYRFDQIQTHGGRGGEGGVAYLDPQNRVSRYQLVGNAAADGPNGKRLADQPVLDPMEFRPKVTTRLLLPVDARAGWPFPPDASGIVRPITIVVQGEAPNQRATFPIRPGGSILPHAGFALLFPGHNLVSTQPANLAFPQRILALASDRDSDGLSDDDEADLRSNPDAADTDGDGLNDGGDVVAGGSPLRADTDGDGLRDGEELSLGTMPHRADSDGDSFWDSAELVLGSNPVNRTNAPAEMTPGLLFSSVTHSNSPGGAYLAAIERASGGFGLLGQPADGFGFGLAFDHFGTLHIADGSRLRVYDPVAHTTNEVGEFDPTNHAVQCSTLAFNFVPTNRALFGVKLGGPPDFENTGQLLRIDRRTGAATFIGLPLPQPIRALAFSDAGKLFATLQVAGDADVLAELDPATGALIRTVGSTGVAPLTGLAFAPDGALLASRPVSAGESHLMLVDQTNGSATVIQTIARQLYGLAVAPCLVPCLALAVVTNTAPVPERLTAVDFDKDGRDDLLQLGWNGPTSFGTTVTFYRSEGDGRFTTVTNRLLGANGTPPARQLVVADLNGDTWPDMVALLPARGYSIVLNDGAGSFLLPQNVNVSAAKALDVADVNGDRTNEMALVADGRILLLSGDGAGGFPTSTNPIPIDPEFYFLDVKLADLNADTWPDLVLMDSAKMAIALNHGNGTFAAPILTTVAFEDNGVAVADFDHDGRQDIIIPLIGNPRGFEIHRGLGNGQFEPPVRHLLTNLVANAFLEDFAVVDFDGDGLPDLVFTETNTGLLRLWMNDDPFGFRTSRRSPLRGLAMPGPVAGGDFNGDGTPDVVAGDTSTNRRAVWLSQ